jgi:nucleoside-diphosphate-sugar epimerase
LIDVFGSSLTYASSGAVYGTSTQTLHSVRDPTFGLDPYTTLKLIHEEMVLDTGGRVLRFSNIFGPTMSEDTVIAKLSQQIRGNLQIPLQQNAVRDYLFVEEAVRAISLTLAKKTPPILNIATGLGRDVNQLVGEIAQVLEIRELRIVREAERQPINCNVLSITETKNVLGWHPSLDFKNQIRRTLFVEKQEK